MVSEKQIEAGLTKYSEGGCMGLDENERREVVIAILTAAEQALEAQPVADVEPFGYWVKHKYAEGGLIRTPCFVPEANHYTEVSPLYRRPEGKEPYLWLHPWLGHTSKYRSAIAADCPKDGPQPIPLYTHPSPSEARLREALAQIDALDPEGHTAGFSVDALRGLIERMGAIARSALAQGADDE